MDIPLVQAVAAVRDELIAAAAAAGEHPQVSFAVGPVDMEFEVEVRADANATAGFRLWVVGAGTQAGVSRGRTHRVSFTLTPKNVDGGELLISSTSRRSPGPGDNRDRISD